MIPSLLRTIIPVRHLVVIVAFTFPAFAQGNLDWEELWVVPQPATPTGTYGWMAGQRQYTGIAYDKLRNVIYIVNPAMTTAGSFSYPAPKIRILDANTGLPKSSMGRDALTGAGGVLPTPSDTIVGLRGWPGNSWGGFAKGQYSLYKVDVDDEGRIYACNLVVPLWGECRPGPAPNCDSAYLDQGPFRIYRWDTPSSTPRRIYATLNQNATAIGSLASSELPQQRLGDAFDVVGKRVRVLDPATQQYKLVDSTRIYVSGFNAVSAPAHDEVLVIQTDTTRSVSDGLGRSLPMRLAKRLISPLAGHGGGGLAAEDSTSLSAVWMSRASATVVKGLQHTKAGAWPLIDTLTIATQLPKDPINGTGPSGPLDAFKAPWNSNQYLLCADGFPSNPSNPADANYNTRARILNVTRQGQEAREPNLGDTPYVGQRSLDSVFSWGKYLSDCDYSGREISDCYITVFLLMSNNGLGAFRSRSWCIPVTIRTFTATRVNDDVRLAWEVEREVSFLGYGIQRRFEGESRFVDIGFVAAQGTGTGGRVYTCNDPLTPQHRSTGRIEYRLKQIDTDGSFEYSPIAEVQTAHNNEIVLKQNHPNPFNPSTTISYIIPEASLVRLTLVNTLGRTVRTLVDDYQSAGTHHVLLDASDLPSGSYTYRLEAGVVVMQRRLTVVR